MATKPQEIAPFPQQQQDVGDPIVTLIERAVRDPQFDVAKFESLLAMRERVVAKQNEQLFVEAMAIVQSEMGPVFRGSQNEHTRSKYATLEAIDAAIHPIYSRHGFSVRWRGGVAEAGSVGVVCVVSHRAGHTENFPLQAPLDLTGSKGAQNKPAVQALGSTITYLRRYALMMAFNVVLTNDEDDDDGEATRRKPSSAAREPSGPDPKAVAWKDKVVGLFGVAQSEAGIAKLRSDINTNYNACKTAWPDMAAEIDAAALAATDRVRGVMAETKFATDGNPTPAEESAMFADGERMET